VCWYNGFLCNYLCSYKITIFANLPPPSKCRLVRPAPPRYASGFSHWLCITDLSGLSPCINMAYSTPPTDHGNLLLFITLPTGWVAKYCDDYVCLSVCLSVCPTPEPHARSGSCSDIFTIGRIAYRQEWVFFPTENVLSAGKWVIGVHTQRAKYACLV